jgi:hypothetical protein
MSKELRDAVIIALVCASACALIVIGDCYLATRPHVDTVWRSLASIATLAIFLPALVILIQMTAVIISIIHARREIENSSELLLRAGLDPTDF